MSLNKGSYNFKLEIPVSGLTVSNELAIRVVFTKPDLTTSFERTMAADQVDINDDHTLLGVEILDGDLDQTGVYQYQVWDETAGAGIKSSVDKFLVEDSLVRPA